MGGRNARPGGDPAVPMCCDGCGRAARDCGMAEHGWTVRPATAGFAGAYCPDCAEMLALYTRALECTECGNRVEDDAEAEREGWRYFPDARTLAPFCADCSEELFGV